MSLGRTPPTPIPSAGRIVRDARLPAAALFAVVLIVFSLLAAAIIFAAAEPRAGMVSKPTPKTEGE